MPAQSRVKTSVLTKRSAEFSFGKVGKHVKTMEKACFSRTVRSNHHGEWRKVELHLLDAAEVSDANS
jgi:hypothetical protein